MRQIALACLLSFWNKIPETHLPATGWPWSIPKPARLSKRFHSSRSCCNCILTTPTATSWQLRLCNVQAALPKRKRCWKTALTPRSEPGINMLCQRWLVCSTNSVNHKGHKGNQKPIAFIFLRVLCGCRFLLVALFCRRFRQHLRRGFQPALDAALHQPGSVLIELDKDPVEPGSHRLPFALEQRVQRVFGHHFRPHRPPG